MLEGINFNHGKKTAAFSVRGHKQGFVLITQNIFALLEFSSALRTSELPSYVQISFTSIHTANTSNRISKDREGTWTITV